MTSRAAVFGLWPVRLTIAAVFLDHGWAMITNVPLYAGLFAKLGIPFAAVAALLVAIAEFFGGFGLLLGVLTRFTSVALSVVMVTAIFRAWLPGGPFFGGWAFDLVILGGLVALTVNGPGRPTLATALGRTWRDPEELVWRRLTCRLGEHGKPA